MGFVLTFISAYNSFLHFSLQYYSLPSPLLLHRPIEGTVSPHVTRMPHSEFVSLWYYLIFCSTYVSFELESELHN